MPELDFESMGIGSGTSKFDLSLFMMDEEEGLTGVVEYATAPEGKRLHKGCPR